MVKRQKIELKQDYSTLTSLMQRLTNKEVPLDKMTNLDPVENRHLSQEIRDRVELWYLSPTSYTPRGSITTGLSDLLDREGKSYFSGEERRRERGEDIIALTGAGKLKKSETETQIMVVGYHNTPLETVENHLKNVGNVVLLVGKEKGDRDKAIAFGSVGVDVVKQYPVFFYNPKEFK